MKQQSKHASSLFQHLFGWQLLLGMMFAISASVPALASGWKDALKAALVAAYPLSRHAALNPTRITHQGVVLVVRKQGIAADPTSHMTYSVVKVKAGQVDQRSGDPGRSRVFRLGEKVYVIDIRVADDHVRFIITSVDTFDVVEKGSTEQTRYEAAVDFEFEKEFLATAPPEKIKAAISEVLATEAEAAAPNTKTIELGQTPEQVERILGKPDKIVNLGAKVTYIYKDMKVIFQDGKVADVQ